MSRPSDEAIVAAVQRLAPRLIRLSRVHPLGLDLTLAGLLVVASLLGLLIQGRLHHLDTIAFCLLLGATVVLHRLDGRLAFAAVSFVALLQWITSTPQIADGAVLVALFWVTLDGALAEVAAAGTIAEAGAVMAAVRWSPQDPAKVWVAITGLAVAAGALGLLLRERRALVASLQERAARLERERDQQGQLGAAAERARIAREMHDIVSHNLTVMIALADGARYGLRTSTEAAQSAIGQVSETGRQALEEMRRLLGVLADEPAQGLYEPQPGLDRLTGLVARVQDAGVPTTFRLQGDPSRVSDGVQLTVFRVAQEALTNTLKHAGRPVSVHVALRCSAEEVSLEITDTGSGGRDTPPSSSGGRGLRGMHERAAAYGGELDFGPVEPTGWRVRLRLDARPGGESAASRSLDNDSLGNGDTLSAITGERP